MTRYWGGILGIYLNDSGCLENPILDLGLTQGWAFFGSGRIKGPDDGVQGLLNMIGPEQEHHRRSDRQDHDRDDNRLNP
jgi:hypothetical protein